MAQLLVAAKAPNMPRGCVVAIRGDDHQWGTKETLPSFVLLTVPDATAEQLQEFLQPKPLGTDEEQSAKTNDQNRDDKRAFAVDDLTVVAAEVTGILAMTHLALMAAKITR